MPRKRKATAATLPVDTTAASGVAIRTASDQLPLHSPLGASSAEVWKIHPVLPLAASSRGRVQCLRSGRVLKQRNDKDGYRIVDYGSRGGRRTVRVARVVCAAWIGFVCEEEVDHQNRRREDNTPDNLRYLSFSANRRNLAGARKHSATQVRCVRQRKNGRYQAYRTQDGKFIGLGCFDTAAQAQLVAEEYYGA